MKLLIQFEIFLTNQNFNKFGGKKLSQLCSSHIQALGLLKDYFPEDKMET